MDNDVKNKSKSKKKLSVVQNAPSSLFVRTPSWEQRRLNDIRSYKPHTPASSIPVLSLVEKNSAQVSGRRQAVTRTPFPPGSLVQTFPSMLPNRIDDPYTIPIRKMRLKIAFLRTKCRDKGMKPDEVKLCLEPHEKEMAILMSERQAYNNVSVEHRFTDGTGQWQAAKSTPAAPTGSLKHSSANLRDRQVARSTIAPPVSVVQNSNLSRTIAAVDLDAALRKLERAPTIASGQAALIKGQVDRNHIQIEQILQHRSALAKKGRDKGMDPAQVRKLLQPSDDELTRLMRLSVRLQLVYQKMMKRATRMKQYWENPL